jgi:predicted dehydrogenase
MDSVRVGLIGCGSIAESELDGLGQVRGARVVATADPVEQRAQLLAHRAGGARACRDYRRLLDDHEVDAVIISTPNFLHARQTIRAAQAGKHVLVQKPLALTLDDIDSMDKATQDAGVVGMALMVMRFQSSYVQLKELLDNQALGSPLVYRTHYSHSGIGRSYRPASDWFLDRTKAGGGPLIDLGVHHLDLLRWLAGQDIASASAEIAAVGPHDSAEDNALVSVTFADGTMGQLFLSYTTLLPVGYHMQRVEVYGTTGSAWTSPATHQRATMRVFLESAADSALLGMTDIRVPEIDPWAKTIEHFVTCIRDGATPLTTFDDGRCAMQAVLASYQSAAEGRRVMLSEVSGECAMRAAA